MDRTSVIAAMVRKARPSSNDYLRSNCLLCSELLGVTDTKTSFAFHTVTGFYKCMRCNSRGKFSDLSIVSEEQREEAGRINDKIDRTEAMRPPEGFYLLDEEPARSSIICRQALRFLEKRGVGEEKRRKYGIGVALKGRFFGRVIIPVYGDDGEMVSYVGRSWEQKADLPYLYPYGTSRGEIFFNGAAVREKTEEPLLVCEGVFDAIALGSSGCAVLGQPSRQQVEMLLDARRPVVFVLDTDVWLKTWVLLQQMEMRAVIFGKSCRLGAIRLPAGTDPDELDPLEIIYAARACLPQSAYGCSP